MEQKDNNYLKDLNPYKHQLKVQRLLNRDDKALGFNFSPTGSGKTFSWLKPAIEEDLGVIAVYPTNSLIQDQYETAKNFHRNYFLNKDVMIKVLTRNSLTKVKKSMDTKSNGKAVEKILNDLNEHNRYKGSSILLTNPDIFLLILKDMYSSGQYMKGNLYANDILVIDEFHMADVKQRNDLLFSVSYLLEEDYSNLEKALFLSATPEEKVIDRLKTGISGDTEIINSKTSSNPFRNSKCIMPEAELEFLPSKIFKTSQEIRDNYLEKIIDVCYDGRTVIMVDGLKEVDEVYNLLSDELSGLNVMRIDGFHRDNIREKLSEFDVLVSNSAVEVGIDFDVKNIVFTAFTKSRFMQRIGRLRESKDYKDNSIIVLTDEDLVGSVNSDSTLERDSLESLVEEILRSNDRPESFTSTYSVMEWISFLRDLKGDLTISELDDVASLVMGLIKTLFSTGDREITDHFLEVQAEKVVGSGFLRDLETYRGEDFQSLVYDMDEEKMKSYNLRHLLRWGDVEFVSKSSFRELIPDSELDEFLSLSRYMDGYCVYRDSLEGEGRSVWISPFESNEFMSHLRESYENPRSSPEEVSGVSFRTDPEIGTIGQLNDYTKDKKITVKALEGSISKISHIYNTSDYMFLYSVITNNQLPRMISAFGLDAFYLHRRVEDNQL